MQELQGVWVPSLSWGELLEWEMTTLPSSCWDNPMDRGAWQATVHGVTKESDTTERLSIHALLFKKQSKTKFNFIAGALLNFE